MLALRVSDFVEYWRWSYGFYTLYYSPHVRESKKVLDFGFQIQILNEDLIVAAVIIAI